EVAGRHHGVARAVVPAAHPVALVDDLVALELAAGDAQRAEALGARIVNARARRPGEAVDHAPRARLAARRQIAAAGGPRLVDHRAETGADDVRHRVDLEVPGRVARVTARGDRAGLIVGAMGVALRVRGLVPHDACRLRIRPGI